MNVVLGHYPQYVALASKLGSNLFSVAPSKWNSMNSNQQWQANKIFLDSLIKNKDQIVFSHHPASARLGSWFFRELIYLAGKGINVRPALDAHVA